MSIVKRRDIPVAQFWRNFNPDLVQHNNFQWQLGCNISATELYFCTFDRLPYWQLTSHDSYQRFLDQKIGRVHVDDDANVTEWKFSYSSKVVHLDEVMQIRDLPQERIDELLDSMARHSPHKLVRLEAEHVTDARLQQMYSQGHLLYQKLPRDRWPTEEQFVKYVSRDGMLLQHVIPQTIRICGEAVRQNYKAMRHVNKDIRSNVDFWKEGLVASQGQIYHYIFNRKTAPRELWENEDLAVMAVQQDPQNYRYVNKKCMTPRVIKAAWDRCQGQL